MNNPLLTIVINFYNNEREAPRSLYTLSAKYQQNIKEEDYRVIAIDNGSKKPISKELVESFGSNFEYVYYEPENPSPCSAVNFGVEKAQTPYVMCIIDGAHMLSPRLLEQTFKAFKVYENPVVLTLPLHLGPHMQFYSLQEGYNQAVEDELLNSIPWKQNGYALYNISNLTNYQRNFFSALYESNCFAVRKELYFKHDGLNEKFVSSGGGLANLDLFQKLVNDSDAETVTLIGEATFHQFHGGTTTNVMKKEQPLPMFKEEYKEIYGKYYSGPSYESSYIGQLPRESRSNMIRQKWNTFGEISRKLRNSGKTQASLAVLELMREMNPYTPEVYNKLGVTYCFLKKWDKAEESYKKAIDLSPANEIEQYMGLANVYLETGKIKAAEAIFQQAAIIDPKNAKIPLVVARFHLEKGEIAKATKYLEESFECLNTRRNIAPVYIRTARGFSRIKDFKKAHDTVQMLMEFKPDAHAFATSAGIYFAEDKIEEAEENYLKALELNTPNPFPVQFGLAKVYEKTGELNKALKHARMAVKINPKAKAVLNTISRLERKTNELRLKSEYSSFIFTHIPKSGGTSVRKYIFDSGLENGILPKQIWVPGQNNIQVLNNIRILGFLGAKMPEDILILADHSYFNVQNDYYIDSLENPFYFTILRDPYERFVSNYYYFYFTRGQEGLKDKTLNELSEEVLDKLLDKEGHTLIRFIGNFKNDEVLPSEVEEKHLKVAEEHLLKSYQVFGLFDKMEETMEMLRGNLPEWLQTSLPLPSLNRGQVRGEAMDIKPEVKAKIQEYITLDNRLYQTAQAEFKIRYQAFKKQ